MCNPDKIQLPCTKWKGYWPNGSSTRYPFVSGWDSVNSNNVSIPANTEGTLKKIELFKRAMEQRKTIYEGRDKYGDHAAYNKHIKDQVNAMTSEYSSPAPKVALLVPSGGKDSDWFNMQITGKYFWAKMSHCELSSLLVIFIVSHHERETYVDFINEYAETLDERSKAILKWRLKVVSYPGFGIGYGRVAGYKVAEMLKCPCWMVDDRAYGVKYRPPGYNLHKKVNIKNIEVCTNLIKVANTTDRIISASLIGSSGTFRVLTVIFPDRSTTNTNFPALNNKKITFPQFLIASKEDMTLARIYNIFNNNYTVDWRLQVVSKQATSAYKNSSPEYPDKKEQVLEEIINSDVFEFKDDESEITATENWDIFKELKFNNLWDAIKIQESVLDQLLGEILTMVDKAMEIVTSQTDGEISVVNANEIIDKFEDGVLKWFLNNI